MQSLFVVLYHKTLNSISTWIPLVNSFLMYKVQLLKMYQGCKPSNLIVCEVFIFSNFMIFITSTRHYGPFILSFHSSLLVKTSIIFLLIQIWALCLQILSRTMMGRLSSRGWSKYDGGTGVHQVGPQLLSWAHSYLSGLLVPVSLDVIYHLGIIPIAALLLLIHLETLLKKNLFFNFEFKICQ